MTHARLGNDTLLTGLGDDSIFGGRGDDHLDGGDGEDRGVGGTHTVGDSCISIERPQGCEF